MRGRRTSRLVFATVCITTYTLYHHGQHTGLLDGFTLGVMDRDVLQWLSKSRCHFEGLCSSSKFQHSLRRQSLVRSWRSLVAGVFPTTPQYMLVVTHAMRCRSSHTSFSLPSSDVRCLAIFGNCQATFSKDRLCRCTVLSSDNTLVARDSSHTL